MACTSSSHKRNAFSAIEPPNKRRKIEQSSKLYDVFINHRGPDVKDNLAKDLYNSLRRLGIDAYLDSQEGELGTSFPSAIETAIGSAKVHIAIFSERYVESPWCLAELVLMLQSNSKIIPLFYKVKPRDLRRIKSGVYDGAFHNYEEKGRYTDKLEEWKEALQSVSFTTGYEFTVPGSDDCKEIVSAVEKEVQRRNLLYVAKHPVGLHKLVKEFESELLRDRVQDFEKHRRMKSRVGQEKGNVVGIFGIGGVGKTTLSIELFNQKRLKYTNASFVFDVREASARGQLPALQSKLLRDLFDKNCSFLSHEEGRSCLRDCFERNFRKDQSAMGGCSSFLIVLDDIDHVNQVDALIPMDILAQCKDCLVIITTRDVGVLVSAGIENSYRLRGLDIQDGKTLFCWHAFSQPHPADGYEGLVEKFVNACGGLPLSLQVLGSDVRDRDPQYWREALIKLSRTLPRDIKQKLKISFDSLDKEEKQIFMDVACFFIDRPKTMAVTIWKGSGWCSHHALKKLKDKCLVEEVEPRYRPFVNGRLKSGRDRYVLRMHDHLRDLGRELADELSHPPRLWRPQESRGFKNIVAQTKGRCLHSIRDESMGCQITYFIEHPEHSSRISLLWLQLDYQNDCDSNSKITPSIPPWVPLQNLQCLKISGGRFRRLWQSDMKAPTHLKELHIAGTSLEEFPSLSRKPDHMEVVMLHAEHFQMDIRCLLRSLTMNLCSLSVMGQKLSGYLVCTDTEQKTQYSVSSNFILPQEEEVSLNNDGRSIIRKVRELENKSKQTPYLVISDFKLPRGGVLSLNNDGWSVVRDLRKLEIKNQHLVQRIVITGNCCRRLQTLKICGIENVIEVNLGWMETLEFLEISDCKSLERLLLIPDLSKISVVKIEKCSVLERVPGIPELTKLRQLCIRECHKLGELPNLVRLSYLERIELDNCNEFQNIMLPSSLIRLSVRGCRNLQSIAGDFTKTTELYIMDCPELEELSSLCKVSFFKRVEICSCKKLKKITLTTKLISLSIRNCECLQSITGDLTEFKALYITNCPQLDEFPSFSSVSCSEQIRIHYCNKLKYLKLPTALISLSLRKCRDLQRVDAGDLTKLTALYIRDCPQLQELPSVSQVSCLEQIAVYSCMKLQHITLPTTLISLSIRSCRGLQRIAVNGDLEKLTKLIIAHCPELEELPTICGKCKFRIFVIDSCEKLQTISVCKDLQTILDAKDAGKVLRKLIKEVLQTISIKERLQTIADSKGSQTGSDGKGLQIISVKEGLQAISDGKGLQTILHDEGLQTTKVNGKGLETAANDEGLHVSKYLRLWYCHNTIIKNLIRLLKGVPRRMDIIRRDTIGYDTAESIQQLRQLESCDPHDFGFGVIPTCRYYIPNWSKLRSIIACFLVVGLCTPKHFRSKLLSKCYYSEQDYIYDYEFDSDSDFEADSYHGLSMRRGKSIITMVASDQWSYSCLQEMENILSCQGMIEAGWFNTQLKKDEGKTSLSMLCEIVDNLHDK